MRNHHLRFVLCSNGQIYGGDFAKICGLLKIYELYDAVKDKAVDKKFYTNDAINLYQDLGISESTIKRYLKSLGDIGLIKKLQHGQFQLTDMKVAKEES